MMQTVKDIFLKLKKRIFKKADAKTETTLDRMNGIMKFINFFASFTGLQFKDDWKRSPRTSIAAFVDIAIFLCCGHTVYAHFPSTDNIILIAAFAVLSTITTRLFLVTVNHDKYMSLVRFIFKVIKSNTSGPRQRILMNMTSDIYFHLKLNISGFCAGVFFFTSPALYESIFNKNLTLVSPMEVPFIDPTKVWGYCITTAFNVFGLLFLFTVTVASSSLFFVSVDAYNCMVSLIELDVGTFDVMCQNKKTSNKTCDATFRVLMVRLMDLSRFSSYLNDSYTIISTVQIVMSYLVVVTGLGGFLALHYVSGIGGAVYLYTELLILARK